MKKIIILLLLFRILSYSAEGQTYTEVTIETPNQTFFYADSLISGDLTTTQKNDAKEFWLNCYNNRITYIDEATYKYNCHAYAWHVSEGGSEVWIDTPNDDKYWDDCSYFEVTNQVDAAKVSFGGPCSQTWTTCLGTSYTNPCDHSAVTTSSTDYFISKWGPSPLFRHHKDDCPYSTEDLHYYSTISISGPSSICINGSTFTLDILPPVDSIIWSCGPNLTISSGQNTSTCTIISTGSGSSWVGARLVAACGDINLPHKTVGIMSDWPYGSWVQNGSSHTLNTVNFVQPNSQVTTTAFYAPATSFSWQLQSGTGVSWSQNCGSVAANLYLTLSSSGNATFVLNSNTSACGTVNTTYTFVAGYMFSFVMAPNPASSEITVLRLDADQAKGKAILKPQKEKFKVKGFSPVDLSQEEYIVSIYNEKQGLMKTIKTSKENCKLDLRGLPPGKYFLHIENEYVLYKEQLIIER